MKNILSAIVILFISYASIAQTVISTKDSSSVADTLFDAARKEAAGTQKASRKLLKKPRRLSPTADLRSVDGLFFGLAYKLSHRQPDSSAHKISLVKSISTKAIILDYRSEWISALNNADIIVNGLADIKGNILNFFGRGNDTFFDRTGDFRRYYRVNFSFYQLEPALRLHLPANFSLSAGPAVQHFVFNPEDNPERYINMPVIVNQYQHLQETKTHAGLVLNISRDTRDELRNPSRGVHFSLRMHGYEGLNSFSSAYAQALPQFSFYKLLGSRHIVLANRVGAGFTIGETAFYQSAFLGSQDNLLGYRKFRFSGDNLVYNNLEVRITLPGFLRSVLRGDAGLIGFYDTGRVWVDNEVSNTIHHGYGAGVFLVPFNRFFVRGVAGFSSEGMQATVALRQRF